MKTEIKIGDRIKSIEDGDCFYIGVVTSINGNPTYDDLQPDLKMLIEKCIWCGEDETDNEYIGKIIDFPEYWIQQIK
jgi:hypothetical protein